MGPRSCGAATVIEASLGYRWIERSVGQSLAVIACVGGEALLQQSEQGPGCLIWLLHVARCMLGECITNSLPSLSLLFVPCASPHSLHPYEKSRHFAMFVCRDRRAVFPSNNAPRMASNYSFDYFVEYVKCERNFRFPDSN